MWIERRRGCGQRLVPQLLELHAAWIAPVLGGLEDLFRLHVQKAQPHRAVAHDAFQVSAPSAAAVVLFVVERDHHVATLPDALGING